mmetsp:Transcript_33953/g.49720  ORF Transcript_33953/g.49720 Transcript_33953/m.49720 type:complete len:266 (+) Transcript_33953:152-949(+)
MTKNKEKTPSKQPPPPTENHVFYMTLPALILTTLTPILLAFIGGIAFRSYLHEPHQTTTTTTAPKVDLPKNEMPIPLFPKGKIAPDVEYSGKNMGEEHASVRVSHDIHMIYPEHNDGDEPTCTRQQDNEHDDEEEHLPAGQHLLIDLRGVSSTFLNDEAALAKSMVETASASGLTLLSYHCHSLTPSGVSCVGVLLESHISFHTWPEEGVITLDLFTCGSGELVPVLPLVQEKFSVMDDKENDEVEMVWSHVLRGFWRMILRMLF